MRATVKYLEAESKVGQGSHITELNSYTRRVVIPQEATPASEVILYRVHYYELYESGL